MLRIKAIGFDLDGTLYPFTLARMASIPLVVQHSKFLLAFKKVRETLRTMPPTVSLKDTQNELLAKELSINASEAASLIDTVIYQRWFRQFNYFFLFPHLRQLIGWLQSQGVKLAVLSDFPIGSRLEWLNIDEPWDAVLSSEEANHLKPHERPFIYMCERLDVLPEQTLYVGNSEAYDIVGASRAGLHTALYRLLPRKNTKSTVQFSSYKFLQKWLQKHCIFE